jgi:hypothetical protein
MSEHHFPNLAGVIKKDDVFSKGSGSYAASYVPWARIVHYLHEHVPGTEFHLRPTAEGSHVWAAPDGTGYVMGYFTSADGRESADFPFPCQDHRNQPIKLEAVSCRVLTDTHRRALCANACFTFGLSYELWAKEEVDAAQEPTASVPSAGHSKPAPKAAAKPAPADPDLTAEQREEVTMAIKAISNKDYVVKFCKAFAARFNVTGKVSDNITKQSHYDFVQEYLSANAP